MAQLGWQGGTREGHGEPASSRLSQEPPAKVTEMGMQECPCGAKGTLGIFLSSL